jgi:hypothetical protein
MKRVTIFKKIILGVLIFLIYQSVLGGLSNNKEWEYFTGKRYGDYIETKYSNKTLSFFGSIKKNNLYIGSLVFYFKSGIVFFNFKKLSFSIYLESPV